MKKGISLIVLVITIIVIIILSGAVILSIIQNSPISQANEATFKSDIDAVKSDYSMYIASQYAANKSYNQKKLNANELSAEYNGVNLSGKTIKDVIPVLATTDKYNGQFEVVDGQLIYLGTDRTKKRWAQDLSVEVVDADRLDAVITSNATLPVSAGTDVVTTIKYSSNASIDTINLDNKLELLDENNVAVSIQPVFEIATPTGTTADTLRSVDVTIKTDGLAEGSYKLKLKSSSVYNIYDVTITKEIITNVLFEIDNTPPANPTMSVSPTGWTNGDVTISITYPADSAISEYSLDGTSWSTYTIPIVVTENNSTVYARATDISGNQSGQSTITIANIDKQLPTVTYTPNGGDNLQTISTKVTVTDVGVSSIKSASLQYTWDTQNSTEPVSGWTTFTNGNTIERVGDNTYYLWIKASDNAGNIVVTKSNSFIGDITPPVNPTMSATPTGWTNGNVTVTITYSADSNIKEYSTNGTTWSTYTSPVVVSVNNTTVYARATDASGNQSSQSTLTVGNIDKTAPSVPAANFNGYTPGTWTSSDITLNLSSTDVGSGIGKYQWSTDGTTWNDFFSSWLYNYDTVQTTCFRAVDNIGNASAATPYYNIFRDATSPANPTMSASPTGWTNGNVMVTITYSSDSNVKEYSTDSVTWNAYTAPVVVSTNNTTVYARGTDLSQNQSGQSTITITNIDKTAPTAPNVNLNGYTSGSWTNGNVTQTFTSTDSQSGIQKYQYTVDGGANWYDCPNPWVINWDGQWQFNIRAIDNAGNIGSPSSSYIIRRDTTAPTIPTFMGMTYSDGVTNYINDTWASQAVYMYGGISGSTDGQSGVNRYQISMDNVNWINYVYDYTLPTYGLTSGGIYYRYARAIDNAGNASSSYSRTIKIDGTAPNAYNMTVTKTLNSITISGSTIDGESGISGYHYYINGSWTGRTTNTSYTFTGLTPGTTYSVYMTAYNNSGIQTGANGGVINVTTDVNMYTYGNPGSNGYGILRTPASTSNPTELCVNGVGQGLISGLHIDGLNIKVGDTISVTYATSRSNNSWYLDIVDSQHTNVSGNVFQLGVNYSQNMVTTTKTFSAINNSTYYDITMGKSDYYGSDIYGTLYIYDIKINGVKVL